MAKAFTIAAIALAMSASATSVLAQRRPYVEWSATPDSPDWTYHVGDKATVTVEIRRGGIPADGLWVQYSVGDDMMQAERKDSALVSNGQAKIDVGTRSEPGFRTFAVSFDADGQHYKDLGKVGYSEKEIRPLTTEPKDFDAFWRKNIREARKTDLSPVMTPMPEKTTDEMQAYKVRLTVGPADRHIYGFLSIPRDGKKHPVVFCPPGAGVKIDPFNDRPSREGFIYFSIEIHGMDPDATSEEREAIRTRLKYYESFGIESRDGFYYKNVYAACVRCIDFLCGLKEWDGRNVFVTGGSQGGALTIVTAALDERVTGLAAFYPALADVTAFRYGRGGGWPRFFSPHYKGREFDAEKATATLAYYDVCNFAKRISAPGFYNNGYADETCCPTSVAACFNTIPAEKTVIVTPTSAHWRFAEVGDKIWDFFRSLAK